MSIDKEEFLTRFSRIHRAQQEEEIDLLLVYTQGSRNMYANLLYLTGYYSFDPCVQGALFIPRTGDPHLLLNFEWDLDRAARTSWMPRRAMSFSRDLASGMVNYCQKNGFTSSRIGLVGDHYIPLSLFREFEAGLPDAEIVSATSLIECERLIKSPSEIEAMRIAARITDQAILAGIQALEEGVSEIDILAVCVRSMFENSADEPAFTAQVSFGKMTEVCMAPASRNILQPGDMVMFDMGCLYQHYVGDLSRTRVFGKPTNEQQKIYDIVLHAQDEAIAAIQPGVTAAEIDAVARKSIIDAGYGECFNHWLGRGIGLDLHEAPFIEQGDSMLLQPGMVFSVEPGIYLPGVGGARVEETVLVTEGGVEVISDMSHREFVV
ncbi:MAG: Xaa-Pro peptidase family protein [Anaerolineales bacterium]|nr:Xaa-Pro peptidase family protein [Anaerolineales bacterium]